MRTKAIIRLLFLSASISWLGLLFTDISVLFSSTNNIPSGIPNWLPNLLLSAFILSVFYFYRYRIERDENLNFVDLLWKVFATGLIATVISLAFRLFMFLLDGSALKSNILVIDFIYLLNLGLLTGFILCAYSVWKRLILYQKSKFLMRIWRIFEGTLLLSLIYNAFDLPMPSWLNTTLLVFLLLLSLFLAGNMKWVAYLNFRQKWTSLLLLLLSFFYLGYYFYTVQISAESLALKTPDFNDFRDNILISAVMVFILIYGVFSFLVILFNLPTTSVFEQKLEEVVNFQRISQSIQTEQNEESVHNILLESSVSTVFADAAWLEVKSNNKQQRFYTYKITESEAQKIQSQIKAHQVKGVFDQGSDKTKNIKKALNNSPYKSILAYPIIVKGESIGMLVLLKELPEGFNREMTKIVSTFANQAGISIENFRLMEEALQNERYKEELNIAKKVQKQLLPNSLEGDNCFDIAAFSESADEVGGDYYDTLRINEHKIAIIVADVSGKGTSAAFHMSQMKGIFHSLAQQEIKPDEFMMMANNALAYCLERGSFITALFFIIDNQTRTVQFARAGHCPILFYNAEKSMMQFSKEKGLGLGVVKGKEYRKYIYSNEYKFSEGDLMVLYTDGITEARNKKGEEFGMDGLFIAVEAKKEATPKQIQEHVISELYSFSGGDQIDDDYTVMVIKFK